MTTSTVLLKAPIIFQLPPTTITSSVFADCSLIWAQDALIVRLRSSATEPKIPALENEGWLHDCLRRSPVKKVYLDPKMETSMFQAWADPCHADRKSVV